MRVPHEVRPVGPDAEDVDDVLPLRRAGLGSNATFITKISSSPSTSAAKAMRLPSGDQSGYVGSSPLSSMTVTGPPSTART
jgi:hypothetical protein